MQVVHCMHPHRSELYAMDTIPWMHTMAKRGGLLRTPTPPSCSHPWLSPSIHLPSGPSGHPECVRGSGTNLYRHNSQEVHHTSITPAPITYVWLSRAFLTYNPPPPLASHTLVS